MFKKFVLLCVMLIFAASVGFPQTGGQVGEIKGTVLTPEGTPMSGVTVTLTSPALVAPQLESVTNNQGMFRFPSLSPGIYELTFHLEGLKKLVRSNIPVSIGKTMTLDITMSLEATEELVVVQGQAPTIDVQNTHGLTTIDKEFLQLLPTQRDLTDYYNMAPGFTGDAAHGSATTENSFNLDGVNLADPTTGTQLVSFGLDIMEEISVQIGGLSAEYGSVKGAVINVVTKQGGNNFSGSASIFYNHESLQSDNTTKVNVAGTSGFKYQYEPTLTLGGPIIKDKLWFFGNLSFKREASYENGYPADDPDNPIPITVFQPYPYLKMSFQPNTSNKFVLSYNYSDRRNDNRFANWDQTESATAKQSSPTHVINFTWTRMFSPNVFSNLKIGILRAVLLFEAKEPNVGNWLNLLTGVWSGSYFRDKDENIRNRLQINADTTVYFDDFYGSHELKVGAEFQLARTGWNINFNNDPATGMCYIFDYPQIYNDYGYLDYGYIIEDFQRKENMNNIALFINDTWSPFKRLTLNLGLRFESNATIWPPQMQEEGPQVFYGIPYNRSITESITAMKWSNLVPRLGLIFDITGDSKTLLKASFGRYIQPNIVGWVNLGHPNGWFYYASYFDSVGNLVGNPFWINVPGASTIGYPGFNDGKLDAPYADELTIGIERELFTDWALSARYIRKWDRNLIEDVDASQLDMDALVNDGQLVWTNWVEVTATDPYNGQQISFWDMIDQYVIPEYYIINPPGAKRDYNGFELTLTKRYQHGWQMILSYVYQKSVGLIPTGREDANNNNSLGTSGLYEDPNSHYNAFGRFPRERRHMLKLQGMIRGPWGINVAGYFRYMSGRRYTRMVSSLGLGLDLYADVVNFAEPLGSNGYENVMQLDLRLEKGFHFGAVTATAFCDMFNVFNDDAITNVRVISNRTSYDFRDPLAIVAPRIFQLGARIEF